MASWLLILLFDCTGVQTVGFSESVGFQSHAQFKQWVVGLTGLLFDSGGVQMLVSGAPEFEFSTMLEFKQWTQGIDF